MSSTTITIGALAIRLRSAALMAAASEEFATAVATDFDVEVEYSYSPANLDADKIAELRVTAIKASFNVHFEGEHVDTIVKRGADLLPLFSHREVTAMEDELLAKIGMGSDL